jgi:4-amino-4-deoxy-L-arabinose transferase-like glycosyltransferase
MEQTPSPHKFPPAKLKITATRAGLAAAVIAALSLGATSAWLRLDRTPPSWDDGTYLTKSLELYDTLVDKGVAAYATGFLKIMDSKPPLIAALPTPIYLALGRRYRVAYVVNLFFMALMFGAVFGTARMYAGPRAGFLAVTTLGAIPVVYGLSHWYLAECGLIALVCAAVYLVAGWGESSGVSRASALGITFGLGLLMKASFAVYVLVPFLYFAIRWRKTASQKSPIAAFVATASLVAAPWYLVNIRGMITTALNAGSARTAEVYGTGKALSVSAIGHYLFNLANATPWLFLAALPLLALIGASSLRQNKRGLPLLCLLWASPVIFLAAGHYRDIRYAAPLYPAVALMFAWFADAALRSRRVIATITIAIVLSLGWLSMVQNSFGGPGRHLELGGILLDAPRLSYARTYDHASWPQREILADLYRLSTLRGGEKGSALLGTNSVRFNADNFTLAAVQGRFPFEIGTTAYLTDARAAAEAVNRTPYFVYKEGGEGDEPNFNTLGEAALQQARGSGRFGELPVSVVLPDGGVAHVLMNTALNRLSSEGAFLSAGFDDIPVCNVTFGDRIQLAGIDVARTQRRIEVKYRWRCLKPMDRDYWCFTHVVDSGGKVIGYLDHRFLDGDPPTSLWKAGDTAVERLAFPLPEQAAGPYELRVGVYHRESGERLSITESTFPLIQERTAAVIRESR